MMTSLKKSSSRTSTSSHDSLGRKSSRTEDESNSAAQARKEVVTASSQGNGDISKPKLFRSKSQAHRELFHKLKNVHEPTESLFSSSSGFSNYRGLINLCILLLVLSNFRVALDNILKYGLLVDPKIVFMFLENPYHVPSATLILVSNIFIQIAFFTEKALAKGAVGEKMGVVIHVINLAGVIVLPIFVSFTFKPAPWAATIALCWYTGLFLKLVSYASVNWWCREEKIVKRMKDSELKLAGPVQHPNNLTQRDLYYFMLAPTYCYELNFPRTPKIRFRFLARRIFEFLFLCGLLLALGQQWIVPTVKNSLKPFQELDLPRFTERIMKLAVPNHVLWLIFFYAYFHSLLNITAELMLFGDRTFYKDWWNAPNVRYFWQNWNIPIHRWGKRHVYEPLLRNGYSKIQANLAVFFISAFFHEFIVSVPLRMIKPWAFLSMITQVPLAIFTEHFTREPWGNIVVWLSLIMGQPLAIMMYYHDYYVQNK